MIKKIIFEFSIKYPKMIPSAKKKVIDNKGGISNLLVIHYNTREACVKRFAQYPSLKDDSITP